MVNSIITVADFNDILDDYAGRTISHTPVTKTQSNITGEETLADGIPQNIKCYVMKTGQNFDFKKAGFIEQGDAIGLFKIADTVTKDDKVTINSEVFRVKESYDVPGVFDSSTTPTYIYTSCNLVLIS